MNARDIIVARGRAYATGGGRYCTLQVYSTDITDMHTLVRAYGGNFYAHEEGWQWSLSKRSALSGVRFAVGENVTNFTKLRLRPLFDQFSVGDSVLAD